MVLEYLLFFFPVGKGAGEARRPHQGFLDKDREKRGVKKIADQRRGGSSLG
jgi:hypothetical protein